jgi:hypothetical protein
MAAHPDNSVRPEPGRHASAGGTNISAWTASRKTREEMASKSLSMFEMVFAIVWSFLRGEVKQEIGGESHGAETLPESDLLTNVAFSMYLCRYLSRSRWRHDPASPATEGLSCTTSVTGTRHTRRGHHHLKGVWSDELVPKDAGCRQNVSQHEGAITISTIAMKMLSEQL